MREEAKERDHRKLGKELDLFMISQEVGQGLPFWLPNGATIRRELERYIVDKELAFWLPNTYTLHHLLLLNFTRLLGHWDHYQEDMFPTMDMGDGEEFVLRPMTVRTTSKSSNTMFILTVSCQSVLLKSV